VTEQFARVAFVNNENGSYLEGEYIADTGPTWLVKPKDKTVAVLNKSEWSSVPVRRSSGFDDIFSMFGPR
jgi:ABC-type sugar transport system substrate-binding protein